MSMYKVHFKECSPFTILLHLQYFLLCNYFTIDSIIGTTVYDLIVKQWLNFYDSELGTVIVLHLGISHSQFSFSYHGSNQSETSNVLPVG